MLGDLFNNPLSFFLWLLALTIAITIHEFAHAYMADRLGDPTPRLQGRLTLNPLAHLDPMGTLMMLLVRFGWGKPVQFDPFNLRNPRRDSAIISIAGPISNFLLATICSILLHVLLEARLSLLSVPILGIVTYILSALLQPIIILNVALGVFNLVPVHPLDGFKIVEGILPEHYAKQWKELEPYGMIFLLFLVFPIFGGVSQISRFISPIIGFILSILLPGAQFI
jgi:Zn-dependent protease